MPLISFTKEVVESITCPAGKDRVEFTDALVSGLYLEVTASGRKYWRLRFSFHDRRRVVTFGDAAMLSLDEARFMARDAIRGLRRGEPPDALRDAGGPLVREFFLNNYLEFVKSYKRSWKTDESVIRNQLVPHLGALRLNAVQSSHITKLVQAMKDANYAPGTINRLLVLLAYGYKLALRWKVTGLHQNPMIGTVHLRLDNRVERYLSTEETARLLDAVRASPNPLLAPIVAFLIVTGARRGEVLSAKWQDISVERRVWRIPRTKSGKVRHVPLSDAALEVLNQMRVSNQEFPTRSPWIFSNPVTGKPFVSVFYSWDAARRNAGLEKLRIHDLRHSFASFLVNAGRSLYEVQELLGHADARTTSRYAHLSPERLSQAVQVVGAEVGNSLEGLVRRVANA